MPTRQLTWTPIELSDASLPSVSIKFDVPEEASVPSEVQVRRFETIRNEFPRLWKLAMTALQKRFDEIGEGQQTNADVLSAGIFIPEPEEDEVDSNFYWCIGLNIRNREPWQGWQIDFLGSEVNFVVFHP